MEEYYEKMKNHKNKEEKREKVMQLCMKLPTKVLTNHPNSEK